MLQVWMGAPAQPLDFTGCDDIRGFLKNFFFFLLEESFAKWKPPWIKLDKVSQLTLFSVWLVPSRVAQMCLIMVAYGKSDFWAEIFSCITTSNHWNKEDEMNSVTASRFILVAHGQDSPLPPYTNWKISHPILPWAFFKKKSQWNS